VHPYAVIGGDPQDRSHGGQTTRLEIGRGNVFREHVTVHRGTTKDRSATILGNDGLFMAGVHIAHDVVIGDGVTLANGTLLGGHVVVGDRATTGGRAAIAPFVRIGEGAFIAAGAMVEIDVPPFVIVAGDRARVRALNSVGLRRQGVPYDSRRALAAAFRALFGRACEGLVSFAEVSELSAIEPLLRAVPVLLALVYYGCPVLCNQVEMGVVGTLKMLSFNAGRDYEVIFVSFDTRETPDMAAKKKAAADAAANLANTPAEKTDPSVRTGERVLARESGSTPARHRRGRGRHVRR